jgi:hypothetical protein
MVWRLQNSAEPCWFKKVVAVCAGPWRLTCDGRLPATSRLAHALGAGTGTKAAVARAFKACFASAGGRSSLLFEWLKPEPICAIAEPAFLKAFTTPIGLELACATCCCCSCVTAFMTVVCKCSTFVCFTRTALDCTNVHSTAVALVEFV